MVRIASLFAVTLRTLATTIVVARSSRAVLNVQSNLVEPTGDDALPRVHLPHGIAGLAASPSDPEEAIRRASGRHVTVTHEQFAGVKMRVKRVAEKQSANMISEHDGDAFCDPTVTSWTGYINLPNGNDMFFYFFESRSDPEKDPLLLWTNGGPGCSSATGLYQELGPCRIKENGGHGLGGPPINGTTFNPYSWNSRANLIIIDQPVNVGFSKSRFDQAVGDSPTAAADIYAFLRLFLATFKRFHKNEFVLTAESYGGEYIPEMAEKILDENYKRERAALKAEKSVDPSELINLKKVSIGNGVFDRSKQIPMFYDFTCTRRGGFSPVLSIETCRRMSQFKKKCSAWLPEACRKEGRDSLDCQAAMDVCQNELATPFRETGLNLYNIKQECLGSPSDGCYPISSDIRAYLDRSDVRKLLGVPLVEESGPFVGCSGSVAQAFMTTNDRARDSTEAVAALLERNIDVLLYYGKNDWICNHLGNWEWIKDLEWTNSTAFRFAKRYDWRVDGKQVGETQSGGGLTWATVLDAGHMVPYDQPEAALALLTRFLDGSNI